MTPTEIRRLAHAINALRPDWPISSLTTFIEKTDLRRQPYRDAAVKLAWVAVDIKPDGTPASETPKRVLEAGPWHRAALIESPNSGRPQPPKREEACRTCGRHLDACICDEVRVNPPKPGDPATGADLARIAAGYAPKHQEAS